MIERQTVSPQPVPQGLYASATRHGDLIFTAGMTPRHDGVLRFTGPIAVNGDPMEHRDAVVLACTNALTAARALLVGAESIGRILNLTVYLAAEQDFADHSKLADHASRYLKAELGENGIGARAAIGVASLPGNASVEIQLVAVVTA